MSGCAYRIFTHRTMYILSLIHISIVSTDMGKAIAAAYGVKHIEVLTGFKYIGEQMLKFEKTGCNNYEMCIRDR